MMSISVAGTPDGFLFAYNFHSGQNITTNCEKTQDRQDESVYTGTSTRQDQQEKATLPLAEK